jgi:hypothetical protein
MRIITALLLLFFTFTLSGEQPKITEIPYNTVTINKITFSWRVNGDMFDIMLSAPTTGWIAAGIDPKMKMKDADMYIGYVKDGKTFILDSYGTGIFEHESDVLLGGTDNVKKASGKEDGKITTLSFSIPMASSDKFDKKLTKGKHKIILAYGDSKDFVLEHLRTAKTEIEIK